MSLKLEFKCNLKTRQLKILTHFKNKLKNKLKMKIINQKMKIIKLILKII